MGGGRIAAVAELLSQLPRSVAAWCVFDNTASGAAIENAWELQSLLQMKRDMVLRPSG